MAYITTAPSHRLTAALTPTGLPAAGWLHRLRGLLADSREMRDLKRLSRHQLRDIGMTEADIAAVRHGDKPLIL